MNEDLYTLLIEKTEGEAALRVKSAGQSNGLEAYRRIYQWFSELTGFGLAERRKFAMTPPRVKKEEDVAKAIEVWEEEIKGA